MLHFYLRLQNELNALLRREEGQDLIEYALIIVLLVVAAVVGLSALGDQISGLWTCN